MTDSPAPDRPPTSGRRHDVEEPVDAVLAEVLAQAGEIATLGSARVEAWGSDVIALTLEVVGSMDPLIAALEARADDHEAARVALGAIAALVPIGESARGATVPHAPLGTSRLDGAWLVRAGADVSALLRFVDAADERHVVAVDLLAGPDGDTLGEVVVGPDTLVDAAGEDDARVEVEDWGARAVVLVRRVADAMAATTRPRPSAVVNGHLLAARLGTVLGEPVAPLRPVVDDVPEPSPRNPDDDAYARSLLIAALGEGAPMPDEATDAADVERMVELAEFVAPTSLEPLTPAERDAVDILEWADWLGAVIGAVRAGAGTKVDGAALVDFVNRCPEVTTSIPKADRARIEWAFSVVVAAWEHLGVVEDGRLTDDGVVLLPAALAHAWRER